MIALVKKIFYGILLINLAYYGYVIYKKGYKFDADDSENSIQIMLKLIDPLERNLFLNKMSIACEGDRCINLHGLTKSEIYQIANQKISHLKK